MGMKCAFSAFIVFSLVLMAVQAEASSDADIGVKYTANSICPSYTLTSKDISVSLKNLGDSRETYQITLQLPEDGNWSGFVSPSVTLSPGEQKVLDALFLTPSYDVKPGTYNVAITATSTASGKAFGRDFPVEVLKCHWLDIQAGDHELCQGIKSMFDVNLTNGGTDDEQVKLSSSEPWADFSESGSFLLKKGQSRTVQISLSPPKDEAGIKDLKMVAESTTSYARNEVTVKADVRKCYSSNVSVEPDAQDVCPCRTAVFKLNAMNTGLMEDVYTISNNNKTTKMAVDPNASKEKEITVDIPCNEKARNFSMEIETDSRLSSMKSNVTIRVLPMKTCYSVMLLTKENENKSVGVGMAVTYGFKVINTGKFRQTYNLTISSADWVHLSDTQVELDPREEKDVYVYAAPPFNVDARTYLVNVSANGENQKGSMDFKIKVLSSGLPPGVNQTANNITLNMSITGGIVGAKWDRPLTQVMLITILAVGVVIILILRFIVLMK
jgi:uncharacterized membrane protein